MNQNLYKCLAIHDMSGVGRCSLSVILPTMSAMGVQVCPLPTAVLSTHTGGYGDVVKNDLTDFMRDTIQRYQDLDMNFECIYSGYFSSPLQAELCEQVMKRYSSSMKVVDPVMGDYGKIYHGIGNSLIEMIKTLVTSADVITPNLTEASILLDSKPFDNPLTVAQARSILARLSTKGPRIVVVTGVAFETGEYGNICFDRERGSYWKSVTEFLPVRYPGTGDLFASVLTAGLMLGDSAAMAMDRATRYVALTIKTTFGYGSMPRDGVLFERTLEWLTKRDVPENYETL